VVKVSDEVPGIGYAELGTFDTFVDRHIDGKPREFSSRKKWKQTLNAHGMFEVPKNAVESKFWDSIRANKSKRSPGSPKDIAADALRKLGI